MTQQPQRPDSSDSDEPRVIVIGPGGMAVSGPQSPGDQDGTSAQDGQDEDQERHVTDLVEQPAKVMRIGGMIRQLLDEVKAAPLDEASRSRLAGIYDSSISELKSGLAPELVEELERLSLPFGPEASSDAPSESELRIAQAQLVGWLEGLFHGIQTAIYAQQMAARAQLEQMRRALPPGVGPGVHPGQAPPTAAEGDPRSGGLYL